MSRINLRMPDHLKARVEHAADSDGLSVNAWLVRAAAAGLDRTDAATTRTTRTEGRSALLGLGALVRRNVDADLRYARTDRRHRWTLGVGDIQVVASDRTDTVVDVRPSDPAKKSDVTAAEQTRVEYADGRLLVTAQKGWRRGPSAGPGFDRRADRASDGIDR